MARSKAIDEYIPNLTSKIFFAYGSPENRGGGVTSPAMWEVHLHQEKAFCDIQNFVARIETGDGALGSY